MRRGASNWDKVINGTFMVSIVNYNVLMYPIVYLSCHMDSLHNVTVRLNTNGRVIVQLVLTLWFSTKRLIRQVNNQIIRTTPIQVIVNNNNLDENDSTPPS